MRILTIVYEYPPVGGGGGRVAQDVCRRLSKRGHELTVLTMRAPGLPRQENDEGVGIRRVSCFRRRADRCTVPEMAAFVVIGGIVGLRTAASWRPDVVHAHFAVPSGAIAWLIRRMLRIPYLMTCHLGDVPGGVPEQTAGWFRLLASLIRLIWRDAAAVTAVSTFVQELARKAYAVTPALILNGAALEKIAVSREDTTTPCRLFFAGRLVEQKDLETALAALKDLTDLPWVLHVAGDGPLRSLCETLVRKSGLRDRVTFLGWVSTEIVDSYLGKSDILLLPSISEGLPIIGVRAIAHGVAIIATDIPGNADVARHGQNALTFPPRDIARCSDALRRLITDAAELQRMKAGSRSLAPLFNIDVSVDQYEQTLREVAAS
jgi:glycosyltransferase involved in cell wall biosynthesis